MRKQLSIFATVLILSVVAGTTIVQAQSLNAQQVLDKALAALGGKESLAKIQTRTASGKVEVKGVTGTYQLWAKAPGRLKTTLDISIQHVERGFDGGDGWEKRTSVRELGDAELERLKQRAVFNALLSYLNAGTPVELKGKKQLLGAAAYEIEFSPKGESPVTFYFDAASFLLWGCLRPLPRERLLEFSRAFQRTGEPSKKQRTSRQRRLDSARGVRHQSSLTRRVVRCGGVPGVETHG